MKRELIQNIKPIPWEDDKAIDRAGFLSAVVAVTAKGSGELTMKVKHSDTEAGEYTEITDAAAYVGSNTVKDAVSDDLILFDVDLVGCKQFIKVTLEGAALSEGPAAVVLGDAAYTPVEGAGLGGMTGAGLARVPAQGQSLDSFGVGGSKKISDLMDPGGVLEWSGDTCRPIVSLKKVETWTEFDPVKGASPGHYFAMVLGPEYGGKMVTVTGTETHSAIDRCWVMLVKDKESVFTIEAEGLPTVRVVFTDTTFQE